MAAMSAARSPKFDGAHVMPPSIERKNAGEEVENVSCPANTTFGLPGWTATARILAACGLRVIGCQCGVASLMKRKIPEPLVVANNCRVAAWFQASQSTPAGAGVASRAV